MNGIGPLWARSGARVLVLVFAMSVVAPVMAESSAELEDGLLMVIIFPVLGEPFIAPNLEAGVLPWRGSSEHFQGIDIDLMTGFAAELGVEVEFMRLKEPGFGGLLPALVAGQGDAVASALTITAERDKIVDFSQPYFEISTVVMTRPGTEVRSIADLEGKTGIGVRGSRPITLLRRHGFTGTVMDADFQTGAYAEVVDGQVDFAIMESASAMAAIANYADLEVAYTLPGRESYGIAVGEGSALRPLLNAYLDRIKANGTLDEILDRHLSMASKHN